MFTSGSIALNGFTLIIVILAAVALGSLVAMFSNGRFVGNGSGSHARIPQIYGYAVCLISLLWAMTGVVSFAENATSLTAPEYSMRMMYGMDPSVTSFEAFRISYDRSRILGMPPPTPPLDTVPEPELRRRYEVLRADRIKRATYDAYKGMITSALTILLASGLFMLHWRWVRRNGALESQVGA